MEIDTSAPEQQFADSDDEREFKETQKNQSTTEFINFSGTIQSNGAIDIIA